MADRYPAWISKAMSSVLRYDRIVPWGGHLSVAHIQAQLRQQASTAALLRCARSEGHRFRVLQEDDGVVFVALAPGYERPRRRRERGDRHRRGDDLAGDHVCGGEGPEVHREHVPAEAPAAAAGAAAAPQQPAPNDDNAIPPGEHPLGRPQPAQHVGPIRPNRELRARSRSRDAPRRRRSRSRRRVPARRPRSRSRSSAGHSRSRSRSAGRRVVLQPAHEATDDEAAAAAEPVEPDAEPELPAPAPPSSSSSSSSDDEASSNEAVPAEPIPVHVPPRPKQPAQAMPEQVAPEQVAPMVKAAQAPANVIPEVKAAPKAGGPPVKAAPAPVVPEAKAGPKAIAAEIQAAPAKAAMPAVDVEVVHAKAAPKHPPVKAAPMPVPAAGPLPMADEVRPEMQAVAMAAIRAHDAARAVVVDEEPAPPARPLHRIERDVLAVEREWERMGHEARAQWLGKMLERMLAPRADAAPQ